jgi:hypothetical protein
MKLAFILFILITTGCSYKNAIVNYSKHHIGSECQQRWKYCRLNNSIKGVIIAHQKATAGCGYFVTASTSIIVTANRDTIRILELCNDKKGFSYGQSVIVTPLNHLEFSPEILEHTNFDCKEFKTYYGIIDPLY